MSKKNNLTQEEKHYLAGMYLLMKMQNEKKNFNVMLDEDDHYLEDFFSDLLKKQYCVIKDNFYQMTREGESALANFQKKYFDFIKNYDVFAHVDLDLGEFALEKYFDLDEEQWENHINDHRWVDLRLAVATFKNISTKEIVFIALLEEKRFPENSGWQFDLVLGTAWEEIIEICESAITVEELGYSDNNKSISGETVLIDIIKHGFKLNKELWLKEEELKEEPLNESQDQKEYDNYIEDPHYRGDCW